MVRFKVFKRTFQARKFPKGSKRRMALNKSGRTSEFQPSNKFGISSIEKNSMGRPLISGSFRTKKEAIAQTKLKPFLTTSQRLFNKLMKRRSFRESTPRSRELKLNRAIARRRKR